MVAQQQQMTEAPAFWFRASVIFVNHWMSPGRIHFGSSNFLCLSAGSLLFGYSGVFDDHWKDVTHTDVFVRADGAFD